MEASTIASILERLEAVEVKLGLRPDPNKPAEPAITNDWQSQTTSPTPPPTF